MEKVNVKVTSEGHISKEVISTLSNVYIYEPFYGETYDLVKKFNLYFLHKKIVIL